MTMLSSIEQRLSVHIPDLISQWRTSTSGKHSVSGSLPQALSEKEIQHAGTALLALQRGLTGSRQLAGAGYMDDSALLGAYLLYYWPVSYMQVSLAASSAPEPFRTVIGNAEKAQRFLRILDLGSGPGPASAAVSDYIHYLQPAIRTDLTLTDASEKALALAQGILQKHADDRAYSSIMHTVAADIEQYAPKTDSATAGYDIIVMSHALNELWRSKQDCISKRAALLKEISLHLIPGGMLFIIEPALLETSRSLLAVRNALCADGFSVLSPCMGSIPCPALSAGPSHTCHAEISWSPVEPVASLAKQAGLDRESVKMSYCIIQPKQDIHTLSAAPQQTIRAKVVSDGMLNKSGRIRFLLCDGRERFAFSAKNGDATAKTQGFFSLRRYDTVEIENAEIRGTPEQTAFGFSAKTKLRIVSRIGE